MIRIVLPLHLRTLAKVDGGIQLIASGSSPFLIVGAIAGG